MTLVLIQLVVLQLECTITRKILIIYASLCYIVRNFSLRIFIMSDKIILDENTISELTEKIVEALKTVYDPEIPVDIYELGLIYKVDIDENYHVEVEMTLTAPGCPVAGEMPKWVEDAVLSVGGIATAKVNLTFDPPWDISMMSEEAQVALNML